MVQTQRNVPKGGERDEEFGEDGPRERTDLDEHDTGAGTVPAPSPVRAIRGRPGLTQDIAGGLGPHLRRDSGAGTSGAETVMGGGPERSGGLGGDMEIELD